MILVSLSTLLHLSVQRRWEELNLLQQSRQAALVAARSVALLFREDLAESEERRWLSKALLDTAYNLCES